MKYEPKQCPIRFGVGVFGDRWSLLIIRDMMLRGSTRFQDFLNADEGISTNVLSNRLSRLEEQQIVMRRRDPDNGRQVLYELTEKGRDLLPVLLAVIGWAEKYDPETRISGDVGERIRTDPNAVKEEILTAMRQPGSSPVLSLLTAHPAETQGNPKAE